MAPVYSTLAMPHIIDAAEVLRCSLTPENAWAHCTLDNAKNAVLFYLVFARALRVFRHVRARGLVGVVQHAYQWVMEVRAPSAPKPPVH
jgi:sphinganine-1-phosphate aldolase